MILVRQDLTIESGSKQEVNTVTIANALAYLCHAAIKLPKLPHTLIQYNTAANFGTQRSKQQTNAAWKLTAK